MKGKKGKFVKKALSAVVWALVGVALCVSSFLVPTIQVEPYLKWVVLALGIVTMVASVVCISIFASKASKSSDSPTLKSGEEGVRKALIVQTDEQRLAQVDLMDDVQFVVYVSRLFQNKGYGVTLAPAYTNNGVSFVAQKGGELNAVICVKSEKVVSVVELTNKLVDLQSYQHHNVTIVTNVYLDRQATEYAKKAKIVVVDRNVLQKQFMKG